MNMLDSAAFDPDDERISRYLDGDLDAAELAAFRSELAGSATLQARLDRMRQVVGLVGAPPEPVPAGTLDLALRHALAAFDGRNAEAADHTAVASPAIDDASTAAGAPVAPVVPLRRRRWWSDPTKLGLSAAAALVLVVAAAALLARTGSFGDSNGSASEAATAAFDTQRSGKAASSADTPMVASDAAAGAAITQSGSTAPRTGVGPPNGEIGSASTAPSGATTAPPTTSTGLAATPTSTTPTSTTAPPPPPSYESLAELVAAARQELDLHTASTTVLPANSAGGCAGDLHHQAFVGGTPVAWGERGDRLVVVELPTCAVLADEPR